MRLAGTYHPIPYLLERLNQYIPGIEMKSALWLDYDKSLYSSLDNAPIQNKLKIKAQQLRNISTQSEWCYSDDIFEGVAPKKQLTLEDEDKLNVLRIYFTSPIDGLMDIISITFPYQLFLKSLNITFQGISTKEKHILRNILSSILKAEYKRIVEEREALLQLEKVNRIREEKIKSLSNNLKYTEQLYSSAIRNIITEYKSKFESLLKKEFIISDQVVFKLAKEQLSIQRMEGIVKGAIDLAYNLNFSKQSIYITEEYIQLDAIVPPSNAVKQSDKNHKVKVLLDNYEKAAAQLNKNGLLINGKNIARQLDPPVTPPAITDSIKRNKSKIAYLLLQYPDKWTLIRKAIRPISQISKQDLNSKVG